MDLILSLALVDRINLLRQEKATAQRRLIEEQDRYSKDLQSQVYQRTEELMRANQTKDQFFALISHDLRGPMGTLSVLFNQIILKSGDLTSEMLSQTRRVISNTSSLLDNLLTWARSQKGELEVTPTQVPLFSLIEQATALLEVRALQKKICLEVDCPEEVYLWADPAMVTTIVRNLLNNALKFTNTGGRIQIKVQVLGEEKVQVEVIDNGIGLTPETRAKLFQVDKKVASSMGTAQEAGTGLGLILCQEFVNQNHGEIGVESAPGQGSRFFFTLPRAEAPLEQEEINWIKQMADLKILLVEDDSLHQKTSIRVLQQRKLNYLLASDGLTAATVAQEKGVDLILMDLDLPVLSGVEAALKSALKGNKNHGLSLFHLTLGLRLNN